MKVISNTSPITSLAAVEQLNLLQELYSSIIIPQAVYDEIVGLGYPVPGTIEVQTLPWIQCQLDEYPGRIVAARLGLNITGVLGVLLVAKRRGLIPSVKVVMDELMAIASFRISDRLYADVLQVAGE